MEGVETGSAEAKEEPTKAESEAVFYPTLRGVDEDEDGDSKMPGDEA
jgi:hypothetical protein